MAYKKIYALLDIKNNVILETLEKNTVREASVEILERVYGVRLVDISKKKKGGSSGLEVK